ncbi:pilus assembly protein [Thioalkalivibrio thiocyanodenitrificans]|uniref:pilus assembly protein n=1 Tax=Thioalkalivibrio thiocyanodenitrificans TaxID=243063 RepID=UPI0003781801|nr:PilC/PilY family type IV pilus protein [Thioalkalivibrio thiocyanodenitrificans]
MKNSILAPLLLLFCAPALGAAVHDPESQPVRTIAPYVLESDNLELGDTHAYRVWFENGGWQGDLIQYRISAEGERSTDVPIGSNPPENGVSNWSARARLWESEQASALFWQERNIVTYNEAGTVAFRWDRLSEQQREALDPYAHETLASGPYESDILNYVRGDRSLERSEEGGIYRTRFSLLGDIVNSRPVIINDLVVVGANDGLVHGFSTADGEEVFAYAPSPLFQRMSRLMRTPYTHTYMADGELGARRLPDGRQIVAGGFGAGGKGLFVLDVSDRESPKVLFEAGEGHPSIGATIGHIHKRPAISRLPNGRWYVVSGNGYGSQSQSSALILIPLDGGSVSTVSMPLPSEGLGGPTLVDSDIDGRVDYAYAGDIGGNLWRITLADRSPALLFSAGADRPITAEPDVARHPAGGLFVYFGTGSLLSNIDEVNVDTQAFYGIWDRHDCESRVSPCVTQSRLISQDLEEHIYTWDAADGGDNTREVRIAASANTPDWSGETPDLGWEVEFPRAGERLLGRPQVRGGRVQFTTNNPAVSNSGENWVMQLELHAGGRFSRALFDFNRDGTLNDQDALIIDEEKHYPLGLNLGAGNISQPAFARVSFGKDAVFLNGALLPDLHAPMSGIMFGGNLDVTTDSPAGAARTPAQGYPDPEQINPYLEADGTGGRVDAHHHAYDKVQGVNYVDLLEIEPRRARPSLQVGVTPYTVQPELNRVDEVVGMSASQRFIVTLTNADLSRGTEIQIGCRVWDSFEYQQMLTEQLVRLGRDPQDLVDEQGQSLVVSLDEILAEGPCANPTIRISITGRIGQEGVLHGTKAGCVNNTHDYRNTPKTTQDLYSVDPHVTVNDEGRGYRWRNGALTVQLLAVAGDGSAHYSLQPEQYLPVARNNRDEIGFGGVYAHGFSVSQGRIVPAAPEQWNGLLYELSLFWNVGDMHELQQQGQPMSCYGANNYKAQMTHELRGINYGQYSALIAFDPSGEGVIAAYADLLEQLNRATLNEDDAEVEQILQELADLFDRNQELGDYHRYRIYAPGVVPDHMLLEIDRRLTESGLVGEDGTPVTIEDLETDLLPALGPNFRPGRRSWIDLSPLSALDN